MFGLDTKFNKMQKILINAVRAYKCKHCGQIVNRESEKQWIKSYCDEIGFKVRLMLVKHDH